MTGYPVSRFIPSCVPVLMLSVFKYSQCFISRKKIIHLDAVTAAAADKMVERGEFLPVGLNRVSYGQHAIPAPATRCLCCDAEVWRAGSSGVCQQSVIKEGAALPQFV